MPRYKAGEEGKLEKDLHLRILAATRRGLLSAANRIVGVIQTELIPAESPPPVLDSIYRGAWQPAPTKEGVDIKNSLPYAAVIEYGARPENIKIGRAMIDALTEWVYRKGLVGRPKSASGRAQAQINARQVAWAIAQSMKGLGSNRAGWRDGGIFNRGGKKGLRIAEKAAKRAPAIVAEEVRKELSKRLR